MKKTSFWKRLGLLLLVSLLLNSLLQMFISLPVILAMSDAAPQYSMSLLLSMITKIALLVPTTAIIPGLLMLCGLRFGAWASLPMSILLLELGLSPIGQGQFLLGYWILALLARFAWLKARDLYYYVRAKG